MDKNTYLKTTEKMKRSGKTGQCCVMCGEDNPALLEMHHIDGRATSEKTVPLCKNCHAKVTMEQNRFPPKARAANGLQAEQIAFWLLSLGALLQYVGQSLIEFAHEVQQNASVSSPWIHSKTR